MKIIELNQNPGFDKNVKLEEMYLQFEKLLNELRKRELPDNIVASVNEDIEALNTISISGVELRKMFKKKQTRILKILEKDLKLVPKNYYRNLWLAVGMTAFGMPIGIVFSILIGDMAFLGFGVPIGLLIGMAVGTAMDKKAFQDGRQIDFEIKF